MDPAHGILIFDLFGSHVRTVPILGSERIQVRDGFIWYVLDGKLERYDMRAFHTEAVPWPSKADTLPVLDARIEHGHLFRLLPDRVLVERIGP